jgi:hypothetical protein
LNFDLELNSEATYKHTLNAITGGSNYGEVQLAETHMTDGITGTFTSFAEWKQSIVVPKRYTGTYGTNGFYLPYTNDTPNLGEDFSGNNNDLTEGGTLEQWVDSPTNNYCSLARHDRWGAIVQPTYTNRNKITCTAATTAYRTRATMPIRANSGKWYWEVTVGTPESDTNNYIGITDDVSILAYYSDGQKYNNSAASAYGDAWVNADVLGFVYDSDNETLECFRNNVSQGVISNGGAAFTWNDTTPCGQVYEDGASTVLTFNFGNKTMSYERPPGSNLLNFKNYPESTGVSDGFKTKDTHFKVNRRNGTGGAASVTNLTFQPDMMLIKQLSSPADDWMLTDDVLTTDYYLKTNSTNAEANITTAITSFNSDGYSLGAHGSVNESGKEFTDVCWRRDAAHGLDIVEYEGNGTSKNISHSLGKTPTMIWVKNLDTAATNWTIYHRLANAGSSPENYRARFDTSSVTADATAWNDTAPTSSQFTVGSSGDTNENAAQHIAYLFTDIPGFCKAYSYLGTNNANGAWGRFDFVPEFNIVKAVSGTRDWYVNEAGTNAWNALAWYYKLNTNAALGLGLTLGYWLASGNKWVGADAAVNSAVYHLGFAWGFSPWKYSVMHSPYTPATI